MESNIRIRNHLLRLAVLAVLLVFSGQFEQTWAGDATVPVISNGSGTARTMPAGADHSEAIPWDQIGTKAGADYHGDGLGVTSAYGGARLHCVFQRLDGEATAEGLWLTSTVTNQPNERFRVMAVEVGRATTTALARQGEVSVEGQLVRLERPGLREEYSASVDGVRQDFVVTDKPAGGGKLRVGLEVTGANVVPMPGGGRLVLERSGRQIAYSHLRATDAEGHELAAQMVAGSGLEIVVDDQTAVYPVRIDPTFSDANWVSMGNEAGADAEVNAVVIDGTGNLYIGGDFATVGNIVANYIAKWDGTNWSALGTGLNNAVEALAISGNTLYVGGGFTSAGGNPAASIAAWDGTNWSALGLGTDGLVQALLVSGGTLYVGGWFDKAGGNPAANISQWNGSSWSTFGTGIPDYGFGSGVHALALSGGVLYAGGDFTADNGSPADNITQWNGSSWLPIGSGVNGEVDALAYSAGTLYVGGQFTTAGGGPANYIAQWDWTGWSALSIGLNSSVRTLVVSGSVLYVGGSFTTAGNVSTGCLAKWDGAWSSVGPPLNLGVNTLAVTGNGMYVGGGFETSAGFTGKNVALWNGTNWSGLTAGMDGTIDAMAVLGDTLYAGGNFSTIGGVSAKCMAAWLGTNWAPVGTGMNSTVEALAVSGNTLYAGGDFTTAGGVAASCVALWNGNTWLPVGTGMSGNGGYPGVSALAVSGGELYAAGAFSTAGGNSASNVARWNGNNWSGLGAGVNGFLGALAVSGNNVYVGGIISSAGGMPAANIAMWDGTNWSNLNGGVDDNVNSLAFAGSALYVGGIFDQTGALYIHGQQVNAANIAKWDGTNWSALGSGMDGGVYALLVSGSTLYAAGRFATAGGNNANSVAQWDGTNWTPLGSGIGGAVNIVRTMAISDNTLYVGGSFGSAGGKVSASAAYAIVGPPSPAIKLAGNHALISWPNTGGYTLQQNNNLSTPNGWSTSGYATNTVNGTNSVSITNPSGALFFRLAQP